MRAATSGHIPAAVVVRARARKKIPTATPERSARPKPGGRARDFGCPVSASSCEAGRLTKAMANKRERDPGPRQAAASRSPIAKANSTGIIAAITAVVGATTAIAPDGERAIQKRDANAAAQSGDKTPNPVA